jgi:hypothetical protein
VPLSWSDLAVASVAVIVGALVQGSVGFGLGMVAAPTLMLIDERMVPAPLLVASMILTVLMTHREWHAIDFPGLTWALGGRVAGVVAGATMLTLLSGDAIAIVFGALVLMAVGLTASGLHVVPRRATLVGAGALSGFMGTVSSIGGPPMALLYQHAAGPRIRGTLSVFFVLGTGLSLLALWFIGRLGAAELALAAALVPGTVLGFALSGRARRVLDGGYTRRAVLSVAAAAGLLVLLRSVI